MSGQKIGATNEVIPSLCFRLFGKQRYPITLNNEGYRKERCRNKKSHGNGKIFANWRVIFAPWQSESLNLN